MITAHTQHPNLAARCFGMCKFADNDDNSQFYAEEEAAARGQAQAADLARRQAVPGILNPYEVPDDMADAL